MAKASVKYKFKCGSCKHWDKFTACLSGICRRYPPQIFSIIDSHVSAFPQTHATNRCGEYKIGL
jgi:hypothetical protein